MHCGLCYRRVVEAVPDTPHQSDYMGEESSISAEGHGAVPPLLDLTPGIEELNEFRRVQINTVDHPATAKNTTNGAEEQILECLHCAGETFLSRAELIEHTAMLHSEAKSRSLNPGIEPSRFTLAQLESFQAENTQVQEKSLPVHVQNMLAEQASQRTPQSGGMAGQIIPVKQSGIDSGAGVSDFRSREEYILQDYELQLRLLAQREKERLLAARQEPEMLRSSSPEPWCRPSASPQDYQRTDAD